MKLSRFEIFNWVLFVLFTLFALVQLNDTDSLLWVILYSIVALVSLIGNFKMIPKTLVYLLFSGYLVYASFHFLYFIEYLQIDTKSELFGEMVYEKPYLEGTREFLGLVLAAITFLFQLKKKTS
jgi:hypothetical protein